MVRDITLVPERKGICHATPVLPKRPRPYHAVARARLLNSGKGLARELRILLVFCVFEFLTLIRRDYVE